MTAPAILVQPRAARAGRRRALAAAWWAVASGVAGRGVPAAQGQDGSAAFGVAVGPQYGSTHVYLAPADVDRFVASFLGTFGGTATPPVLTTITPTPSSTTALLLRTPVGMLSVLAFRTPIPFPFGAERTGYLVRDLDVAVRQARAAGAAVLVEPFADPIGRDAIIQWPGGVTMQLYWHSAAPSYPPLATTPENRLYVPADCVTEFVRGFTAFSGGTVISDQPQAAGAEIGRPERRFRRIRVLSAFGRLAVLVTDGHLPYPFGRETTGYAIGDLDATLARASAAGARILAGPYATDDRRAAMLEFPGGHIVELHAPLP